jgi:AcrR family transcriptional regulator
MLTSATHHQKPRRRRTAGAWKTSAPVQQRARDTMERFAAAAEALLEERPFERISVQDIATRAGRPIGSFYARFQSKEALLPFLYERYDRSLERHFNDRLERIAWGPLDLVATVEALVGVLVGLYLDRRWLLRALALFARQRPEALSPEMVERRKLLYAGVSRILLRHRRSIRHDDPEEAIRFGIFLVSSVARDRLLFSEAPHARVTELPVTRLRGELTRALHAYLTARPAA